MSRGGVREDYGPASAGVRNKVSVLVRNIPLNYTAEDLRAKFEKFGELRDVYIPRDYYTQRSRGFGFIEFRDARDADEAIYQTDRTMLDGREINVCLSKEGRKTPREMMILETKEPGSSRPGGYGAGDRDRRDRRRSRSPARGSRYSRSPHGRGGRYSRSRSPRDQGGRDYDRDRDRGYDYERDKGYGRDRGYERERDRHYDDGRNYDRDGRGDRDRGRERDRSRDVERDYEQRNRSRSPRDERDRELSPDGRDPRTEPEEPEHGDAAPPVNDYY
ncbi:hypothetical protein VOLCADRAFT_73973 [Volvox carteri f. nagariensis]|uniref:RRM domain-containing protein n=1 Tax=Volvox carteri f. nagariensis TaxID=3068 RepID=D8TR58_VOLCA|nr:uncharacterized protein VOLCADRAFT_73973 [Volvox carteri f. nagariensis]EFJ50142.1 hypothetical protein VOLCADRAFT_73973 [Volvox carteri f. nagariensis]|eukprot:XP_002948762.1 hypothetical protein VOLCADRAFT_73973 [Volvox carteri f. nagariensis]